MKAPKVTPGPWVAKQRAFGYPKVAGGPVIRAWDVESASGVPVAVGTIAEENEANAVAIAALLEMTGALERILKIASDQLEGVGPAAEEDFGSIEAEARDALRKAGWRP